MSRGTSRRHRSGSHDDNPRERLLSNGTQSLSDAELVEILLRNGCPGSSAEAVRGVQELGISVQRIELDPGVVSADAA